MNVRSGTPSTQVALSSASVYPDMCADAFEIAAGLGFDGIEVMVWTDPVSQDVNAVKQLAQRHQLPVLAVHAPTLLVTQRVWGRDPWVKLHRSAQMAVDVGANTVVVHPPFRWQKEYAAAFVDGVYELEEQYGIAMAVENMYPWRARRREMMAYSPGWDPIAETYRNVTIDLSHAATAGMDSLQMVQALGTRLAHVHMADGSGSAKDEHLLPGRGTQPCAEVLEQLAQWNWPGTVALEINTRKAKTKAERESEIREALTYTRLHLGDGKTPVGAPPKEHAH